MAGCRDATLVVVLLCCVVGISRGWRIADRSDNELGHAEYNNLDEGIDKLSNLNDNHKDNEIEKHLKNLPKNDELFEGDMVMDSRLRNAVLGISKKTVINYERVKWPGGVLVYEVDPKFLPAARNLLTKAIIEFHKRTCIQFKKRTNERDYVYYSSKLDQCSSNIGKIGGKQVIHIGEHCLVLGTVLHETMHALGFIHEHSRADRDSFLKVNWDNIEKDEWSNFNKYHLSDVDNRGVEYNFASVMHYRNDAFTKNGRDTLIAKEDTDLKFGQRIKFSVGDVAGINSFYECQIDQPDYNGLFKDYSGHKDTRANKEAKREKMRRFLRDRIYRLGNK